MTYTENVLRRFHRVIFLFEIFFIGYTRNVYVKSWLKTLLAAKRTEEIIFHAECEKSVQICVKSHELLVHQELKVFGRLPVL